LARNEPFASTAAVVVLEIDSSFQHKWLERMASSRNPADNVSSSNEERENFY